MINFIFARRDLQPCIDRLSKVLDTTQLSDLVKRLNTQDKSRLPAMWELVMLNALSRTGDLRHEVALPSGRKPDFEVTYRSATNETLVVVGDVVTVSDAGLEEQNPIRVLFEEGPRIARRVGLDPCHLSYRVDGDWTGRHGDQRVKLQLPDKGRLIDLMNSPVKAWMVSIQSQGLTKDTYKYDRDGNKFTIEYDQKQQYHSGSYTSYNVAASLEKNPLYKALKAKRDQLDGAAAGLIRLIIVCDGDCAVLGAGPLSTGHSNYSAKQIASHFLNKSKAIDAVLLVTVDAVRTSFMSQTEYKLRFDLEVAEKVVTGGVMSKKTKLLNQLLRQAAHQIPAPYQMPINAARRCRDSEVSRSQNGAYKMESNRFSISARGLLDLLSGAISSEKYHAEQPWEEGRIGNIFKIMKEQGRSISSVKIEPMKAADDDWITFEFGEPDPAASPFTTPGNDGEKPT